MRVCGHGITYLKFRSNQILISRFILGNFFLSQLQNSGFATGSSDYNYQVRLLIEGGLPQWIKRQGKSLYG
jgi:hypothetical protein